MKLNRHLSADRIGGLIWVSFGAAIVYGSWVMDRLPSLNIPPATVPGLVPGLLGAGLMIFGAVLVLRPIDAVIETQTFAVNEHTPKPEGVDDDFAWNRLAWSWAICMVYAAVFLGRGIHYWILTAAFLALHMLLLDETDRVPARPDRSQLVTVGILAPAIATVVSLVFQYIFLVRLP